ncbi:MAG: hypothetical protein QQW96_11065 [Tychonema bourrellyi B0820]|uniref:Uncharacterized protein n=1 Tax=Tychonema bourrellyi FEM_GT703 TaxID=2040638 RepID=A0A2G4F5W3_9CYAN|nr:hypothetical protein [Tychonema bourrellyi]MDQ2098177.1 hypothetical protein [Tychonema bourrellyi B0820]PHX57183.1 hypothetical protein CP500_001260 [Tychonema bourrellyi FEM_GT703]
MVEILIWSLMVGSLGLESVIAGKFVNREQLARRQKSDEEEEVLTRYESQEEHLAGRDHSLSNGNSIADGTVLEYKIVRASSDLFRNPAIFQRLCREEAEFGWILLEKLDDRRVRFKRAIALRDTQRPDLPPFDPYRTHYGPMLNGTNLAGAIVFLSAMLLPAVLGYTLVSTTLIKSRSNLAPAPIQSMPSPGTPDNTN